MCLRRPRETSLLVPNRNTCGNIKSVCEINFLGIRQQLVLLSTSSSSCFKVLLSFHKSKLLKITIQSLFFSFQLLTAAVFLLPSFQRHLFFSSNFPAAAVSKIFKKWANFFCLVTCLNRYKIIIIIKKLSLTFDLFAS